MAVKLSSQATVSLPKKLVTKLARKHDMPQKAVVGLFDEFIELTARADKSAARIDPLIKRVAALVGSDDRATAWFYYQPIAAFGGKTASELVAENRRDAVSLHLDTLENGVFA